MVICLARPLISIVDILVLYFLNSFWDTTKVWFYFLLSFHLEDIRVVQTFAPVANMETFSLHSEYLDCQWFDDLITQEAKASPAIVLTHVLTNTTIH